MTGPLSCTRWGAAAYYGAIQKSQKRGSRHRVNVDRSGFKVHGQVLPFLAKARKHAKHPGTDIQRNYPGVRSLKSKGKKCREGKCIRRSMRKDSEKGDWRLPGAFFHKERICYGVTVRSYGLAYSGIGLLAVDIDMRIFPFASRIQTAKVSMLKRRTLGCCTRRSETIRLYLVVLLQKITVAVFLR